MSISECWPEWFAGCWSRSAWLLSLRLNGMRTFRRTSAFLMIRDFLGMLSASYDLLLSTHIICRMLLRLPLPSWERDFVTVSLWAVTISPSPGHCTLHLLLMCIVSSLIRWPAALQCRQEIMDRVNRSRNFDTQFQGFTGQPLVAIGVISCTNICHHITWSVTLCIDLFFFELLCIDLLTTGTDGPLGKRMQIWTIVWKAFFFETA